MSDDEQHCLLAYTGYTSISILAYTGCTGISILAYTGCTSISILAYTGCTGRGAVFLLKYVICLQIHHTLFGKKYLLNLNSLLVESVCTQTPSV